MQLYYFFVVVPITFFYCFFYPFLHGKWGNCHFILQAKMVDSTEISSLLNIPLPAILVYCINKKMAAFFFFGTNQGTGLGLRILLYSASGSINGWEQIWGVN